MGKLYLSLSVPSFVTVKGQMTTLTWVKHKDASLPWHKEASLPWHKDANHSIKMLTLC
jgi:hypothetical protein